MIVNLLDETMQALKNVNSSFDMVLSIQCEKGSIPKEKFLRLANINYDRGFGSNYIISDLVIIAQDDNGRMFWLTRGEYDGSEWWEFHMMPTVKTKIAPIESLYDCFILETGRDKGLND